MAIAVDRPTAALRRPRAPHAEPVGAVRGGVCRGCRAETTLTKTAPREWTCRDCGHVNRGYFPTGHRNRQVPAGVVDLYRRGFTIERIAKTVGFSPLAVSRRIQRAGVQTRRNGQPRGYQPHRWAYIDPALLDRYGELSVREIAEAAGVSRPTVTKQLRARGIDTARACGRRARTLGYTPSASDLERSLQAYDRARKALELRAAGMTWKQVGVFLSDSPSSLETAAWRYRHGRLLVQRMGLRP